MQHSLIRAKNETVKLFSHKKASRASGALIVYQFNYHEGITDITPAYTISNLNTNYYSTEIVTPNESCYLLILFNNNPIVLRVGSPKLQFIYWTKRNALIDYKHYNEFGALQKE